MATVTVRRGRYLRSEDNPQYKDGLRELVIARPVVVPDRKKVSRQIYLYNQTASSFQFALQVMDMDIEYSLRWAHGLAI
jgi:hypothetical protein